MVSQVLCADLYTRNLRPQYGSISGMNGSPSRDWVSSSVEAISSALRTSTHSPARRFKASYGVCLDPDRFVAGGAAVSTGAIVCSSAVSMRSLLPVVFYIRS